MFLKPKERLRIEESNDRTYLEAKLQVSDENVEDIRNTAFTTYDNAKLGTPYCARDTGLISKMRSSVVAKLNPQFSWLNKYDSRERKTLDITENTLVLHTENGYLRSVGQENGEGNINISVSSQGKKDFVDQFYTSLKKTQNIKKK